MEHLDIERIRQKINQTQSVAFKDLKIGQMFTIQGEFNRLEVYMKSDEYQVFVINNIETPMNSCHERDVHNVIYEEIECAPCVVLGYDLFIGSDPILRQD